MVTSQDRSTLFAPPLIERNGYMLSVRKLTTKYNQMTILDQIDLDFYDNEVTVLVGPSGAGKSTLLRSLNALVQPTQGIVQLEDLTIDYSKPVLDSDLQLLRQRMTMVFQSFNLFNHLNVLENVTEGPIQVLNRSRSEVEIEATQLLNRLGLKDYLKRYPDELSGGQQQRVAIARAIIMQPNFLLLDEPTSALDPELEIEIIHVLEELATQSLPMILVTHNLAFAQRIADRIIFMEDGHIYYDGSADDFFNHSDPRIQQYLQSMFLTMNIKEAN